MNKKNIIRTLILFYAWTLLSACTKEPETKLPDSEKESIFNISQFQKTYGELKTSSTDVMSYSRTESFKAFAESPQVKVEQVNFPGIPKSMFENLYINAPKGTSLKVTFDINPHDILLSKIVNEKDPNLTLIEKQIAKSLPDHQLKIPLFLYKIKDYGVLSRITDSYGQNTTSLRLKPTSWENASHVQLSFQATDRYPVDSSVLNLDERDQLFMADKLEQSVFSSDELNKIIQSNLQFDRNTKVVTKLNGEQLLIYQVSKLKDLTDLQKQLLNSQTSTGEIIACSDSIKSQLSSEEAKDCVMISRYTLDIEYKKAVLATYNYDRAESTTLRYDKSNSAESSIIEIKPNILAKEVIPNNLIDPKKVFLASELKGEFLFRRTLNDSPNSFPFTFPGAEERLEIVKFELAEDRIIVKKSDPLLSQEGQTQIDTEEVMSFPAKYFKLESIDDSGNALAIPNKKDAKYDDPGVYVDIDWTGNTIDNVLSPLNYYSLGSCFSSKGGTKVTNMDQKLAEGYLNFSFESSYVVSPHQPECAQSYITSDYSLSGLDQRVFGFNERISFRKYNSDIEKPISNIPSYAQKLFNYGVFTSSRLQPNSNGNIGRDGSEVPMPNLFNFKTKKQVVYTLSGLPQADPVLKQRIINATRTVVNNWNIALRKAFLGSDLESKSDYIVLEVDEKNQEHLGDLNKNFIYYLEKPIASGVLGIGGPSPNPRTGVIEASDIIIYGGNLKSSMEDIYRMAKAKRDYLEKIKVTAAEGETGSKDNKVSSSKVKSNLNSNSNSNPNPNLNLKADRPTIDETLKNSSLIQQMVDRKVQSQISTINSLDQDQLKSLNLNSTASALQLIAKEIEEKSISETQQISQIANKYLLDSYKGKISPNVYQQMQMEIHQQEFQSQVIASMNQGHQVVESMGDSLSSSVDNSNILDRDPLDVFIEKYEAVLVHEMGHGLGLTHNFEGSYDGKNFFFENEDSKSQTRITSSVMDYLPLEIWKGATPGPYDVHAIRAAYTNRVEVSDEVKALAQPLDSGDRLLNVGGQQIVLSQGKYIDMDDLKNLLGLKSWLDFSTNDLARFPLKQYEILPGIQLFAATWPITQIYKTLQFAAPKKTFGLIYTVQEQVYFEDLQDEVEFLVFSSLQKYHSLELAVEKLSESEVFEDILTCLQERLPLWVQKGWILSHVS